MGQGSQEDNDSVLVDKPYINKNNPRGFDYNNESNQGWSPRGIQFLKINVRKVNVKGPITWIF